MLVKYVCSVSMVVGSESMDLDRLAIDTMNVACLYLS